MKITIQNLALRQRDGWFQVTCPTSKVAAFAKECILIAGGKKWRAVRGKTSGSKTVFRVLAKGINTQETLTGELLNVPHEDAGQPFAMHPWVSDDLIAIMPQIGAAVRGSSGTEELWGSLVSGPSLIDHSAAHQRWWLRQHIKDWGIVFDWWADILSDDPVIQCWGKVIWSDRNDSNYNRTFQNFAIRSGEMFLLDFAKRHGAIAPGRDAQGRWVSILNNVDLSLQDGAGLPISGVMLSFISNTEADPALKSDDVKYINMLAAAKEGPIVAVSHDWDGEWCANKNIPRFGPGYKSTKDLEWEEFVQAQDTFAGWFAPRPVGIGLTPGQTGDQEDFGACKGTYAVTEHDPKHIRVMQYSVYSELFRGINLFEQDATPLSTNDHPGWVTWSGVTHYSIGVSPDRLGKAPLMPPPGTRWLGYDDQHRSQNNLAAYASLSDDPLADSQIAHQYTVDSASYRVRFPAYGQGAARAQGRVAAAWANFMTVTSPAEQEKWGNLLRAKMSVVHDLPPLNVSGPMKVLAWGNPDPRKPIYQNGQLAPWASMWEHGLAAVGIYCANKAMPTHMNTAIVLRRVCSTLAEFAFFEHNGQWYTVDDILYSNGEAPPGGLTVGSQELTYNLGVVGVANWTLAGLLVAREVLGSTGKLDAYINAMTGGVDATSRRTAEWWAAIRSI